MRVLVVEDELPIRWSVAQTLSDRGHVVIDAEDAQTAVRALAEASEPFDAVLLDFRLRIQTTSACSG
jgi:DNA-binding response OmpR family regulator